MAETVNTDDSKILEDAESAASDTGDNEEGLEQEGVDPPLPITEHLAELRSRLLRMLLALVIAFAGCYSYAEVIVETLLAPLLGHLGDTGRGSVIFTGLTEPFMVQIKASLLAAFFIALPYIAFEGYGFLKPAFRGEEKAYVVWLFVLGGFLFGVGSNFGYFGVLPYGVAFLISVAGTEILPQLSIAEYFGFAVRIMLAFGLVFEMPLAVTLLARIGLVDRKFFIRNRRIAILLIFVTAAILTPPDVLTQVMLGLPLIILYEISAQLANIIGAKDEEEE